MPGMTMLPTVLDTAPDLSANEFEVGYISQDGTRHRVSLADVRAVRFEVMAPVAPLRRPEGAAASAGPLVVGHRWPATSGTSRGWSATT